MDYNEFNGFRITEERETRRVERDRAAFRGEFSDGDPRSLSEVTVNAAPPVAPPSASDSLSPRRLGYLVFTLCFVMALALLPSLAERISYALARGAERARYEEAAKFIEQYPTDAAEKRFPFVAKMAAPSVVGVKTDLLKRGARGEEYAQGQGSGVIVDSRGFIVTNFHVICEGGRLVDGVQIVLNDGRAISDGVRLIGFDEKLDLAVLKIEADGLTAIEWGDSDALEVGDSVLALGNPYGLARTVTGGIISAKERFIVDGRGVKSQEFLQTDAAVNPGNSGGALVDDMGRLVGINTAIYGDAYQGISFAIPSVLARKVYDEVLAERGLAR
ncbi:MAG: trypsin-like peptidase domain-containing protein [Thermoguttaceae bacterium]|nr:trypsin-like peptidase domain-containing protein [Thermoguttaceae bacterium]